MLGTYRSRDGLKEAMHMTYVLQPKPDANITLDNGADMAAVATLADEYGGRAQISVDDHCYVLMLKQDNERYKMTAWWFHEAVAALHTLPKIPDDALPDRQQSGGRLCVMFYDAPHTNDLRQECFAGVIGNMRKDKEWKGLSIIPTLGFPASRVDLGWLSDRAYNYWCRNQTLDRAAVTKIVEDELPHVVQRLKKYNMEPDSEGFWVSFSTKDDHGWYDYGFSVSPPRER